MHRPEAALVEAYTISYDKIIDAVCVAWRGAITSQKYREGCKELLALALEKNAKKWIFDATLVEFINVDDEKWAKKMWLTEMTATLVHNHTIAYVLSKNSFSRAAVNIINQFLMKKHQETIEITERYFNTLLEARAWLFDNLEIDLD